MASIADKYKDNVSGAFYIDTQCINCNLCEQTAPDFFKCNEDKGYTYVSKQPATDEEKALCQQALEECPVEAIGSDGQ
ncbi:MAG: ferredoxin [Planctomycetota bacterium]